MAISINRFCANNFSGFYDVVLFWTSKSAVRIIVIPTRLAMKCGKGPKIHIWKLRNEQELQESRGGMCRIAECGFPWRECAEQWSLVEISWLLPTVKFCSIKDTWDVSSLRWKNFILTLKSWPILKYFIDLAIFFLLLWMMDSRTRVKWTIH